MSKILVEFDTETKSLKVLDNGTEVTDVVEAEFYKCGEDGGPQYACEIVTVSKDTTQKTLRVERLIASENEVARRAIENYFTRG